MDGAAIAGGGAAAAQALPALIGRGKSNFKAEDMTSNGSYDPFAFQFGNYGAENYKEGREQQARAVDQRQAFQADYSQANQDRTNAAGAREGQQQAAQLMMNRATGRVPSIAMTQAAQDMQRAQASQASMAASARGPAGLALAQQNAANNTANAQGRISGQAQVNAANERMQAEQAAFGAASGMRGQDYQGQGQAANQAQFQAGMQAQNRGANDQRAMGYAQMGHQALGAEQQGRVQMQGNLAQSQAAAQAQNAATDRQNAENKGLIESVGDWFSDERTKYITSDFTAKLPAMSGASSGSALGGVLGKTPLPSLASGGGMTTSTWGGGGMNPVSGPAEASSDVLTAGGGGMDVMGSIAKHANYGTRFVSDPTSGMTGGVAGTGGAMIMSDDRTKLKEAFEEGAKYADAGHAGVQIKVPDYAKAETKRNPAAGPAPTEDSKRAEALHADRVAAARFAAAQAAQPKPLPIPPAAQQPMPIQRAIAAVPAMPVITSDFTAKEPLRGGSSTWEQADPTHGQFRYVPGRGWIAPDDEQRTGLNAAIEQQAGQDREDADLEQRVAEQQRKDAMSAQWARDAADENEPKADDGKRMAPGTADFEKTEPKAEGSKGPSWYEILNQAGRDLNQAQFGHRATSDRRAKNVIDLDEVDADEGTDKSTMRDGSSDPRTNSFDKSFRRDTPADQARVKRGVEDKAGKDADEMMASMRANLGRGSSVDERVAASLAPSRSPVAEANRTMKGQPYIYKPQFTPPEQKPGEPNFGFMAQNLEKSPITATAVKEDPSGLKRVDAMKLLRVLGASVADLQEQQDETRIALSKGGRKK